MHPMPLSVLHPLHSQPQEWRRALRVCTQTHTHTHTCSAYSYRVSSHPNRIYIKAIHILHIFSKQPSLIAVCSVITTIAKWEFTFVWMTKVCCLLGSILRWRHADKCSVVAEMGRHQRRRPNDGSLARLESTLSDNK